MILENEIYRLAELHKIAEDKSVIEANFIKKAYDEYVYLIMMTDKAHKEFHNKIAKNKFIAGKELI